MSKTTNLTPDQKKRIWRAVLAFIRLILHIGEKHVENVGENSAKGIHKAD